MSEQKFEYYATRLEDDLLKAEQEIERLRAEVKRLSEIYDSGYIDGYDDARENNVDEIERLRAENERLREELAVAASALEWVGATHSAKRARAALEEKKCST